MLSTKGAVVGALLIAAMLSACGGGNAASQMADVPAYEPKGQTKCGVEKSQARPLIVEWPSADRQQLEAKVRGGLVAVRYQGCEMTVLERCIVPGKYGYQGTTRAQDKVVVKDEDDLYANLPVGAARLEGQLQRSGQLTVAMNLVGRFEAQKSSVRADELQGDCTGATHFIYGASVGAFDFYAGADVSVGGGAVIGVVGAGAQSQASRETLTKNGDPDACAKAASTDKLPPEGCGALIRIEVVPIGQGRVPTPTCPDGAQWDGAQCVGTKVVTQVSCPPGTKWDGGQCAPTVNTRCAPGSHFAAGQGCVTDTVSARAPKVVAPPPPAPASAGCPTGMAQLRGGTFTMGDRKDTVTVQPFCLDVSEVTAAAYTACVVRLGTCSADGLSQFPQCNYGLDAKGAHPINCVDWQQATNYCQAQGKRLPTEEEWEWAARGGSRGSTYPWGNTAPDYQLCWSGLVRRDGTCAVGSFPEGDAPPGIHDLAGNVWEWTQSSFDPVTLVVRGGSRYYGVASFVRAAYRFRSPPALHSPDLGFRCAR